MKTIQQTAANPSITFCIAMDLVGCLSFAIPGIGEFSDVVWAPLSAFIFLKSFGGKFGATGAPTRGTKEKGDRVVEAVVNFLVDYMAKFEKEGLSYKSTEVI